MSERRCETCRWWRAPSEPGEYGECDAISEHVFQTRPPAKLKVLDDTFNALYTLAEFSCALHEEKA